MRLPPPELFLLRQASMQHGKALQHLHLRSGALEPTLPSLEGPREQHVETFAAAATKQASPEDLLGRQEKRSKFEGLSSYRGAVSATHRFRLL